MRVLDLSSGGRDFAEVTVNYKRDYKPLVYALIGVCMIVAAIGYNLYLDHGCRLNGVMTWQGKQCIK